VEAIDADGSGAFGPADIPLEEVDRIIAIGSNGMMNAVAEARRALEALSPAGSPGDRFDQLADADEGDLRAVPAIAGRSRHRERDGSVLSLQPGSGDGPRRFRGAAPGVQEKLNKLWIARCLHHLGWRQPMAAD